MELPGANFSFEVVNAAVSSDRTYDLTLAAASDLPVGDPSRVKVNLNSLRAAGSAQGLLAITGQGSRI